MKQIQNSSWESRIQTKGVNQVLLDILEEQECDYSRSRENQEEIRHFKSLLSQVDFSLFLEDLESYHVVEYGGQVNGFALKTSDNDITILTKGYVDEREIINKVFTYIQE